MQQRNYHAEVDILFLYGLAGLDLGLPVQYTIPEQLRAPTCPFSRLDLLPQLSFLPFGWRPLSVCSTRLELVRILHTMH